MPSCQELTRLISSDELAEANRPLRLRAWFHLLICRHCRRYAAQIRAIAAGARKSWGGEAEDPSGLARLEARILDRCFDEREDPAIAGGRRHPTPDPDEPGAA